MSNEFLAAALAYAKQCIPVFPLHSTDGQGNCDCDQQFCANPGKHPWTAHGLKDATTNLFQIRTWWGRWPSANVGLRTGGVIVVLDADDGPEGLKEANDYGIDLRQLHARTGNGHHFPLRVPEGVVLRNRGKKTSTWPFKHCDARGEGGYVVAAPSRHWKGRQYVWSQPFDVASLPELPPTLLEVWRDPTNDPRNRLPLGDDADGTPDDNEASAGGGYGEVTAEYFLARYTRAVLVGGADRNPTGFALALQLRDAPLPREAALPFMRRYHAAVETARPGKPDYAWREAEQSLDQAYSQPARAPIAAIAEEGRATWAAQRYLAAYGDRLRYVHSNRRWFWWTDGFWKPERVQEAARLGQELVMRLYDDARGITGNDVKRKAALSRAMRLDNSRDIRAMVELAAQWEPIRAEPRLFDSDPWLATVANGTLDLRLERSPDGGASARLRPHSQADMLTRRLGKRGPLTYAPDATCPNWEAFLRRVFVRADGSPDDELIGYLRRWCGYTLTGMVSEQMLLVLHGEGANGKRTFVQAIEEVLGAYGETIPIETLLAQRFEGNAGPAELAKLDGARFVQCGENNAGRSLNEARIKILTGNDPVDARHLRGDPFSFDPQFKLLLHTNHRPKIRGRDKGIWRRVKLIPFNTTIPEGERDPQFFEHQLAGELEGILAWMVRGCLDWQARGLGEPLSVTRATEEYRAAEDVVRQFAAEVLTKDANAIERQKTLHDSYRHWCSDNSVHAAISSQSFAERLSEVTGCERRNSRGHGQEFYGIRLRVQQDGDEYDEERCFQA